MVTCWGYKVSMYVEAAFVLLGMLESEGPSSPWMMRLQRSGHLVVGRGGAAGALMRPAGMAWRGGAAMTGVARALLRMVFPGNAPP